ncbi:MAG: peptidyl-prolyl cis-trans isomerase [Nitrospirae bacterium]|nr:MAG: peptidyl-prolyl cis-trans isomerase [Nitrospirota bacterium]
MRTRRAPLLALCLLVAAGPAAAAGRTWRDADVIVRVGPERITFGEFKEAWLSSPLAGVDLEGERGRHVKLEVLKGLVDRKLVLLDARRSKTAEGEPFRRRMAPYAGRKGPEVDHFRDLSLAAARFEELRARFTPDAAELKRLYRERTDLTTLPEKIRLQICVVKDRKLAEEIARRARGGENLNRLVQRYSIVPGAKEDLGVIGWVARGQGDPAVERVAFGLEAGEVGGPVQGPKGWYVVRVLGRKPRYVRPFEEVKERLRRTVREERLERYLAKLAEEFQPAVEPAFLDTPLASPRKGEGGGL